jgi:purine-nucleoside phosphorylase
LTYIDKIEETVKYIIDKISTKPEVGLILGSGLGGLAEKIEDPVVLKYKDIPNFPISTVEGHAGQLVIGRLGEKQVIAMQGRFHYYEGYNLKEITFPIRCMIGLGIDDLIVTNAAGGVNSSFKPGDLMIIKDHINFAGNNPLIGKNLDEKGPRFVDMTYAYNKDLINIALSCGKSLNLDLKTGVYMWFSGPTYETPAEVKMAGILGADAVGMSTVPEVIVANHEGIRILGISCITNMASGILDAPLNHEEVVETSMRVKNEFEGLVIDIIKNI